MEDVYSEISNSKASRALQDTSEHHSLSESVGGNTPKNKGSVVEKGSIVERNSILEMKSGGG